MRTIIFAVVLTCMFAVSQAVLGNPVAKGVVRPGWEVELRSAVSGALREVAAEGDRVEAGQVVAVVDEAVARARVEVARARVDQRAALDRATAAQQQARQRVERVRQAVDENSAKAWELQEAETKLAIATAAVEEAREAQRVRRVELDIALATLERHTLRSAGDAEVVRVVADVGASVSTQTIILELADLTTLRVDLYLPVSTAADLRLDDRIRLDTTLAETSTIVAAVAYIDPRVDAGTGRQRCVLTIENPDRSLPSGFEVTFDANSTAASTTAGLSAE